jgi:hypothetical protein
MIRQMLTRAALAAMVAAPMLPMRVDAQVDTVIVTEHASKADRMEAKAASYYSNPKRWADAARLFERSASLRAPTDVRAAKGYERAAHVYFAMRDMESSRSAMLRAADRAQTVGDVLGAADAYLDAAWLSGQLGDSRAMEDMTVRARALASSPLITAEQRGQILERAGAPARLAARVKITPSQ